MKPQDDPTIARIRETRHRISERFGHDPRKLIAYYIELQKKYQDRVLDEATSGPAQAVKGVERIRPAGFLREEGATYGIQGEDIDVTAEVKME